MLEVIKKILHYKPAGNVFITYNYIISYTTTSLSFSPLRVVFVKYSLQCPVFYVITDS